MIITENARKNARKSRESAKKRIKEDIILIKTVSLQRENVFNMYKSRAIPTLSGENAEYFREIQAKMEHTNSQTDWQSVGEGVLTMMKKAGNDAWGI